MVEKLSPIKAAAVPALTEQTTQPALRRLPITELATQAKLDVLSSEGLAALATATGNAAAAAVGTSAPAAAAQETPRAAVAPPPTPPAAVPAPPPPPAEATAPRPPRPPRVSQLIAALQANQGPPPPMELGTAAPPDSARRVSPGLMDPAPDILSGSSSISVPSNSEEVVASPPPPAGPLGWMLRHQEAVAALIGATLVVLAALLYVFLKPL